MYIYINNIYISIHVHLFLSLYMSTPIIYGELPPNNQYIFFFPPRLGYVSKNRNTLRRNQGFLLGNCEGPSWDNLQ